MAFPFDALQDLIDAIYDGDLESVKRLFAEGADVKKRYNVFTPFLRAAAHGYIPIMHWVLTEGGSSLAEQTLCGGESALLLAACNGRFSAMQWLLEEQGASIADLNDDGRSVWIHLSRSYLSEEQEMVVAELSSLLKIMVMLQDAHVDFIAKLLPQHAEICTRGRQLRAQLPSYLEQHPPRSPRTATCQLCCNPSSPRTPRPPRRRTCGRTVCVCKHP
jgi:hypothetical protein